MDKWALVVAVVALGGVGYAIFGTRPAEGPAPATAASVEALQAQVALLEGDLLEARQARQESRAAAEAARAEEVAAVDVLERQVADLTTRLAKLEADDPSSGRTLVAEELILKSADGKTVLRLGARTSGGGELRVYAKSGKLATLLHARSDDDGELALYDHTGALRANIGGNDAGGYANFYGRSDKLAAYIGGDAEKDSGYVSIYAGGEQEVVGLYGNPKGGVLSVRNQETKKQIVMIGAAPSNGAGFIGLGTVDGKPALAQFVTENGGQVKALNADGKTAAFLGVSASPAGHGLLYVSNKRGTRVIEGGATESAGGYVSLHNEKQKRVLFMGASSGTAPDDGVLEVGTRDGKLGVVLRGYGGGSSVRVYDKSENVIKQLR